MRSMVASNTCTPPRRITVHGDAVAANVVDAEDARHLVAPACTVPSSRERASEGGERAK